MVMSPPGIRETGRSSEGYTLLEILVATGVLVLLGGGLAALMSQAIGLWKRAESQAQVYEQARVILDTLARDLRSTVVHSRASGDDAAIRFVCDRDTLGRQRLRFVRTISGETRNLVLRKGGRYLGMRTPAVYDGRQDRREADQGLLAAPGGLMEVLYALDSRPGERWLWRGFRSPIGGNDSLFHDRRIESSRDDRRTRGGLRRTDDSEKSEHISLMDVARPVTDGVLFLGLAFWGPTTNTWDPLEKALLRPEKGRKSGPVFFWDSTRALLDQPGDPDEFVFRRRLTSLNEPSDDIFPEMVEITLVLRDDDSPLGLRLGERLDEKGTRFKLSRRLSLSEDPRHRFLLVEDEWIAVEKVGDRTVTVASGGRGVRDTEPRKHAQGSRVELGMTFHRVVEIPGHRRGLEEKDSLGPRGLRKSRSERGRR